MGSHWVDTEKLIFKKLKTIYSEEQSCTDSNLHIKNLGIMLKCIFKVSRSDWGLRIHVPSKFSDKTLVQKGNSVVGRAFTLELRSPGLQFDFGGSCQWELERTHPFFFPLHHSQPQHHHLSWTHWDCPNHLLYPIPCQDTPRLPGCFPTPPVESWLASEPVLSPLPIPSQVLKSFSLVLQNFVNCQHNL